MTNLHKITMTAEFQRDCAAFVQREVIHSCDELVQGLSRSYEAQQALDIDDEQMTALCYAQPDIDAYRDEYDGDSSDEPRFVGDSWISDNEALEGCEYDDELEAWQALYDETGQCTPDGQEALCFLIVSDWLANKLEQEGQPIARDICGFTIWGRCTFGQLIASDSVIERIYWHSLSDERKAHYIAGASA